MTEYSLQPGQYSSQSRVDWVDYAKGFCIIFVVMMHSTLGVEKHAFEHGLVSEGAVGWMNAIVTFAQPFRMPDFFLISGLFLGLVIGRSWLRYIDRKVVHFAYFYVLWLAIQFTFRSVGGGFEGRGISEIVGGFGTALLQPYGTLWFIYMLPVMFLATRLLIKIHWSIVLAAAAVLEVIPIHSGYLLVDEFAARYVYFFIGYALAQPIFKLADWARNNLEKAAAYLGLWAVVNGIFTSILLPENLEAFAQYNVNNGPSNFSHLPGLSLVLGIAGAIAVVCVCAVLSRFKAANFLRYLGSHSIVVYLAFFLPMAVTREALLRLTPGMDMGTMSLIVLLVSVGSSVLAYEFTQRTGWFKFLFNRPKWASIEKGNKPVPAKAALHPAE